MKNRAKIAQCEIGSGQLTVLRVVTKAYQLHMCLSLANSSIQTSLKHSSTKCERTQLSACALCSCYVLNHTITNSASCYVLNECKQLRKTLYVYHYIGCIVS